MIHRHMKKQWLVLYRHLLTRFHHQDDQNPVLRKPVQLGQGSTDLIEFEHRSCDFKSELVDPGKDESEKKSK